MALKYQWFACLVFGGVSTCAAQSPDQSLQSVSIAELPRPGYEPRTITIGAIVVAPRIEANVTRNDNVFATPTGAQDDIIYNLQPSFSARRRGGVISDLRIDANANLIRYDRFSRENVTTFRGDFDWQLEFARHQTIRLQSSFDRTYQRRSDPEADFDQDRPPALINVAEGAVDYRYNGPKFGLAVSGGATLFNFKPREDDDRDFAAYRGSIRGSYAITPRARAFLQGYVLTRDARLPVDRFGINRDLTTVGALTGVSFDVTSRVQGELGVGVFRANPADPTLESFSGIAASGQLVWRPRVRTAVTLDAFRGDVATIRAGAVGRVDTRIGLALDQEVRHNLLLRASAGIRNVDYRGAPDQNQRYRFGEIEGRYLLSRQFSLVANANYTRRQADREENRFRRWLALIGVRFTY